MNGAVLLAGATGVARAPSAALFALGLGLWVALRVRRGGARADRSAALPVLAALVAGWVCGGLYAAVRDTPEALAWIALASVPLVGVGAALDVRLRASLLAGLAFVGGGLHGAVGAVAGEPGAAPAAALVAGAFAALGASVGLLVRGPRTRIAVRVGASWIAAIGILLVAWQARPRLVQPVESCSSCAAARLTNAWCDTCRVGWVASFEIESKELFEALDAHGHDLDRDLIRCTTCVELIDDGGFCEACRFGWVGGQAYMSRLTYHLAKGTPRARDDVGCATCAELFGGSGWCEASNGGWAGSVWFLERQDHADAVRELERLHAASAASTRCETCALVILVDGECPYCRIRYVDGKPVDGG